MGLCQVGGHFRQKECSWVFFYGGVAVSWTSGSAMDQSIRLASRSVVQWVATDIHPSRSDGLWGFVDHDTSRSWRDGRATASHPSRQFGMWAESLSIRAARTECGPNRFPSERLESREEKPSGVSSGPDRTEDSLRRSRRPGSREEPPRGVPSGLDRAKNLPEAFRAAWIARRISPKRSGRPGSREESPRGVSEQPGSCEEYPRDVPGGPDRAKNFPEAFRAARIARRISPKRSGRPGSREEFPRGVPGGPDRS